jgi:dimethylhistidine N-methyltransferase
MNLSTPLKSKVELYDLHPPVEDFRAEVLQGLMQEEKTISPKFLYDKNGAVLFDDICSLEEYYLTRTEISILRKNALEIGAFIDDGVLIEFGSGSSQKVRPILDATVNLPVYVALDISKQHLYESCLDLANAYDRLKTIAICTDYTQPISLPPIPILKNKHRVAFFPGSSIGNLEPIQAIEFLKNTAALVEIGGSLLIGVDLKKSKAILEPAYKDSRGISAAFAMNLLTRMNRELGTDFNLNNFTYDAFYNPLGRIEMYLVSLQEQIVRLDNVEIHFARGERLRTEHSYKYSIEEFQALAIQAGFQPLGVWCDRQQLFSVHYLQVKS